MYYLVKKMHSCVFFIIEGLKHILVLLCLVQK